MTLVVRGFRANDSSQFLEVVRHLQTYELAMYDRMKPVEAIGDWYIETLQAQCAREKGFILVAELDGRVAAFAPS